MSRPSPSDYAPFYETYVSLVPESEILQVLEDQSRVVRSLTAAVPPERETFRYGPGKWSIRELIGHVGDAERVFGFRAFCISRGEQANLPSFDEKEYTAASTFDQCRLSELADEWAAVRASNLIGLRRLRPAVWNRTGTASGHAITVRALAFIMAGHVRHHLAILRSRYGVEGAD